MFNLTDMKTYTTWAGLKMNYPDEYKCICCWATKPPDEIDWDIWEQYEVVMCIDCGMDGLEIAERENDY